MSYPGLRNRHRTGHTTPHHAQRAQQPRQQRVTPPTSTIRRAAVANTAPLPPPMAPSPPLPPPVPPPSDSATAASNADDDFLRQAEQLIPAQVRLISGCHTEQTSADVRNVLSTSKLPDPAGRAGGACTSALLDILYQHHHRHHPEESVSDDDDPKRKQITFQELLLRLRSKLASQGHSQIPQLSSSRPLDVEDTPFDLGGHTGTKRALLVGINYRGMSGQLSGCHNDVSNMRRYLVDAHGFAPHHVLCLTDDDDASRGHGHHGPTRRSIVLALRQLVAQSQPGDAVFVHYSGHGGLLEPAASNWFKRNLGNNNNNNPHQPHKEFDETLIPLDHQRAGEIRDFHLYRDFVQPMPAGVVVTAVFDCCHSGSVLDLPFTFQPTSGGMIRTQRNMDALANVGMLYLLMGGMFPSHGFDSLTHHIQNTTGGSIEDYQGMGLEDEDMAFDGTAEDTGDAGDGVDADTRDLGDDGFDDEGDAAGDAGDAGMGYADTDDVGGEPTTMGGDWTQTDFDGGDNCDGGDVDCGCMGDVLSDLLSGD